MDNYTNHFPIPVMLKRLSLHSPNEVCKIKVSCQVEPPLQLNTHCGKPDVNKTSRKIYKK